MEQIKSGGKNNFLHNLRFIIFFIVILLSLMKLKCTDRVRFTADFIVYCYLLFLVSDLYTKKTWL